MICYRQIDGFWYAGFWYFFPFCLILQNTYTKYQSWCCYLMNYFATPFMRCMDVHVNSQRSCVNICLHVILIFVKTCLIWWRVQSLPSCYLLSAVQLLVVFSNMFMQILTSIFCVKVVFYFSQLHSVSHSYLFCLSKFCKSPLENIEKNKGRHVSSREFGFCGLLSYLIVARCRVFSSLTDKTIGDYKMYNEIFQTFLHQFTTIFNYTF